MKLRIIVATVAANGLLLSGAGCGRSPVAPARTDARPEATTPQNAVRRLEWAINHWDVEVIRGLLTDDMVFLTAATDSAGNPVRSIWPRSAVLAAIENLLVGTASRPPAESLQLSFDRTLVPLPDPRPGKVSKWHKTILTSVAIRVRFDASHTYEATGNARFFLTRGDSAAIPAELEAQGVKPDSLRWWIDRWEDETIGTGLVELATSAGGGVPAGGTRRGLPTIPLGGGGPRLSFGAILRLYLP